MPRSLYDPYLFQEIPQFICSAEGNYSAEPVQLARHPSPRDADESDTPYGFAPPNMYFGMDTSFHASVDEWLNPVTIQEDSYNFSLAECLGSSGLPCGYAETRRETPAGDRRGSDMRGYEILHQDLYRNGRPAAHAIPPIQYHGFSLNSAYRGEYHSLTDADHPAWPADIPVAAKLAIVFCFPGKPQYHRQVHIKGTGSRVPVTRGKLASIVAREIQAYMEKLRAIGCVPLRGDGVDLAFERLVIVDIQHISKGSLQPTIGFTTRYD